MDLYRFRLYNVSFLKSGDFERHLEKDFFVKKKRKKKLSLGALLFQTSSPSSLLPKCLGTKIEPRWHAGHGHLPRDKARESNRIRINQPGNPLLTIRRLLDTYLHDFLWKQSLSQDFWRGPFAGRLISRLAMIFLSLSLSLSPPTEETPIPCEHSGPLRNEPSFISRAWVCIPPIINYLISTVFNQENGGRRFDSIPFDSIRIERATMADATY